MQFYLSHSPFPERLSNRTDARHEREVAIKVLHTDVAGAVEHDRFAREIKLAASLTHPHILPLYDSGESDVFCSLSCQLCVDKRLGNGCSRIVADFGIGKALAAVCETNTLTQVGMMIGTADSRAEVPATIATLVQSTRHTIVSFGVKSSTGRWTMCSICRSAYLARLLKHSASR